MLAIPRGRGFGRAAGRAEAHVRGGLAARVLDELDLAELAEGGGEVLTRDLGPEPLDEQL